MKTSLRTHSCGELKEKDLKKEVKLAGWIDTRRDHGGIIFIDLLITFKLRFFLGSGWTKANE